MTARGTLPAAGRVDASDVDVLLPTAGRPEALAVTLTALAGQTATGFRVLLSDQSSGRPNPDHPAVAAVLALLPERGIEVMAGRHLPARGMAEHRAHLLSRSDRRYVLFLDDDVLCEPEVVARLRTAIEALDCGFVGAAVAGLRHLHDQRPADQAELELWGSAVQPERVRKGDPGWERWRLHNAATVVHLARALGLRRDEWAAYKVCWVSACALYDARRLRAVGGFDFWPRLPANSRGEDVVASLRVMERYGGAGILPSGAYHLELPTTLRDRRVDAYSAVLERDDRQGELAVPAGAGAAWAGG